MSMKTVKESKLTTRQIEEVMTLYEECNRHDGTRYVFDVDDDFKQEDDINTFLLYEDQVLVSSLNIFAPTLREAEIIGLTLPGRRKSGYFKALLHCAAEEINRRNIASILFVCDSGSKEGRDTIIHLKAAYEYSEFLMEYRSRAERQVGSSRGVTISPADESQKDRLAEINRAAFGTDRDEARSIINEFYGSSRRTLYSIQRENEVIGMIGVYDESTRTYIYGFCIDTKYQRQGIGSYVLDAVVQKHNTGGKKIVLEVQADNARALRVYENAGFVTEAEFQYYRDKKY